MAIATKQGHVQRAIEFYNKIGKYFIVGGTLPWSGEGGDSNPPSPSPDDYKLIDVVGLKRVDNCHLVVPDANGTISYRTQNWRIVVPPFKTTVVGTGIPVDTTIVSVNSLSSLVVGTKVRIHNVYDATILAVDSVNKKITLDIPAPESIPAGATIEGGALVEGAKYVYIDCYLNYDQFPVDITYRQIGVCTEVTPSDVDVLRSGKYSGTGNNEYTSLGVLEIIDNRPPSTRDIDQRESLSIICEF